MTATSSGSPSSAPERRPARRRPCLVLDANALLLPFRTGLDLGSEVDRLVPGAELIVPVSVLGELDRLVDRRVRHAAAARALAGTFRRVPNRLRGDDAVREAARAEAAGVVTADAALAHQLAAEGIVVLAPRDRVRLDRVLPARARRAAARPRVARRDAASLKKRARLERRSTSDARRRPPP